MNRQLPLLAGLLVLLLAPAASAQGVTAAALTGLVTDDTGLPLPGANVLAVHEPTGSEYGTITRTDGRFDLLNLRVGGPYTVTVSFIGYQTATETGLSLTLGQTRELSFELSETVQELGAVEVVGEESTILSSERTGASTNIDETTIERLPTISRSLADFARLSPFATADGQQTSVAGRNNRYNNIQIDGATLNDVFGLSATGAPGGQAGAQPISLDAIQEFNVDVAPYDVRYNGFTGGSINAITKSGRNDFFGSVRYLGRNQSFVGDRVNDAGESLEFADFSESYFVGTLGGPIIQNKLFFFANAEYETENTPLSTGIAGSGAANIFDVGAETFDEIRDIAQSQYGYDPGGFDLLSQDQSSLKLLGKLDWNVNPANRATLRVNYVDAQDDDGIGRGDEAFDFSNRQYVFDSNTLSSVAELRTTLGSNMFNEARLVYTRVRDSRNVEAEPFPEVTINVEDDRAINLGIDRFSQANALDQDLVEFTNNFSTFIGDHSLLFGTSNQVFTFSNLFIQDYYGAYEFNAFDEVVNGDTVTVGAVEAFRRGIPTGYNFSYSLLDDEQPRAEFTAYQLGLYAQDQWTVLPTLTVTLGLRVDLPVVPDEPLANPLAEEAFGRNTDTNASGNPLWSPRVGFNWDASGGTRETQLRGGTGIFSGRTPFVWISNQFSNTGVDFGRVDATIDVNDDGIADPASIPMFVPSADPADQPRPGTDPNLSPVATSEINLVDEDFKFPQVWRTNLAVDQRLPYDLVGTLEGIYSKSINEIAYRNLNLEQTGTSAYGRPIYGETFGFFGDPARVNDNFTNALLLENSSEGYEWNLTAQLQRQVPDGVNGRLAYTYTRAENVNNATSSRAISNWQFNENFDVNDPRLGTADFEIRHRVLANVSYRFAYADRFATSIGLFYEGRSGSPFSWIYVGDANADGQSFNDLVFVPATEDEVVIEDGSWEVLDRFISEFDDLDDARGSVVERNSARIEWQNILDLQLAQEIQTVRGQRVEITANVLNVLNLLNSDWGQRQFIRFDNVSIWDFEGYADDGRPIIEFDDEELTEIIDDRDTLYSTNDLASRWQLQLGVRYTF